MDILNLLLPIFDSTIRLATPMGCDRPINATAMPINPAPSTEFRTSLSASPITLLIAMHPARAPEISIETMMIFAGEIPAYSAAGSE